MQHTITTICIEAQALNLIIDISAFQPLRVYIPTWHHNVLSRPNLQSRKKNQKSFLIIHNAHAKQSTQKPSADAFLKISAFSQVHPNHSLKDYYKTI